MLSPRLVGFALVLAFSLVSLTQTTPARAAGPICTVAATGGTYPTLATALADTGCATIQIVAGTFETNVTITRPVVIEGAGAAITRLDGGGMNRFQRVVTVDGAGPVELRNLALVNGDGGVLPGGALFNSGTLTLTNVLMRENAGGNAGGLRNTGTLTIIGSTITENRGGSVGGVLNDGTLTLRGSVVSANRGRAASAIINTAQLTMVDTMVAGNISDSSVAVNIFQGSAVIESSAIVDNSGGGGDQGLPAGLLVSDGASASLKNSRLLRNGPGANCGGAITLQGVNLVDDASCGATATIVRAQLFLPVLKR